MENVFLVTELLACFALPIGCGLVIVLSLTAPLPALKRDWHFLTTLILGAGAGFGLLGCLFFIVVQLCAGENVFYWIAELILVVLAGVTFAATRKHHRDAKISTSNTNAVSDSKSDQISNASTKPGSVDSQTVPLMATDFSKWDKIITACLVVSLVAVSARVGRFWTIETLGSWDAWSYWNCRALGIYRAGSDWKILLSTNAPFADYPMLLPSIVAGHWKILNQIALAFPKLLSLFFTTSLYALLFSALAQMRGLREAKLGTLLLLGTQVIVRWFVAQTADAPYCFYILSAVVSAASYALYRRQGYVVLCGFFVGLACFTKTEGLLFTVANIGAAGLWASIDRNKTSMSTIKNVVLGMIVPLSMALFTRFSGAHDYLSNSPVALYEKRTILHTLELCLVYGTNFGNWAWNPLPLLAAGILTVGWQVPAPLKPLTLSILVGFCLTAAIYVGIYLLNIPAYQDIEHNFDRLIGHWWPILIFIALMVLRRPEDGAEEITYSQTQSTT